MTFIVGTDTYVSLVDARSYVTKFGLTPLPTDDAAAEQLLTQASYSLDRLYGNRYLGTKSTTAQTLAWPRLFANAAKNPHGSGEWLYQTYDSDGNARDFTGLQPETANAAVELAVLIQAGESVNAQPDPALIYKRVKADTVEKEIHMAATSKYVTNPFYGVELILRPLLINNTGSLSIARGK